MLWDANKRSIVRRYSEMFWNASEPSYVQRGLISLSAVNAQCIFYMPGSCHLSRYIGKCLSNVCRLSGDVDKCLSAIICHFRFWDACPLLLVIIYFKMPMCSHKSKDLLSCLSPIIGLDIFEHADLLSSARMYLEMPVSCHLSGDVWRCLTEVQTHFICRSPAIFLDIS